MSTPAIEFENVSFSYGGAAPVLAGVSFRIPAGAFVLVKGPSGSGKSTLLRLICRLESPESGRILLAGADVTEISPSLLRRRVGYLQQTPVLAAGSIRDNLLLPFSFAVNKDRTPPTDAKMSEVLDRFGLEKFSPDHPAGDLSVGQRQRLCLIRSLLPGPEVLLMDEPTSALDAESAAMVQSAAESLNRQKGVTVLFITHQDWRPRFTDHLTLVCENTTAALT